MQFTEHSLELSIMELFENEGYTHQTGQDIHREKTDVLLPELLSAFLLHRYADDGITESEIVSIMHTAFKTGHWSVEKGTFGAQKRTA